MAGAGGGGGPPPPLLALGVVAAIAVAIVLAVVVTTRGESSQPAQAQVSSTTHSDAETADVAPSIEQEELVASDGVSSDGVSSEAAVPVPTATPAPSFSCREGLLVNERCRIAAPVSSSALAEACAMQGGLDDGDTSCFRIVDPVTACPTGAELSGSGCAVSSPARQTDPTCPAGSELVASSCQRTTSPTPACSEGQLIDDVCRIERAPAHGGDLSCAGGGPVTDGQCTVWTAGSCGTAAAVSGGCAQPAPVDKRDVCPANTVLRNSLCEPTAGCPTSTSSKAAGVCGSPPVPELVCSATGQPVNGGECFTIVAPTCPSGFQLAGSACSAERAATHTAYRCEAGQLRIGTSCIDEQAPTISCSPGELVGDSCVVFEPALGGAPACSAGATLVGERCLVPVDVERSCAAGTLAGDGCRVAVDLDPAELCGPGQTHDYGWCVRFEDPVVS